MALHDDQLEALRNEKTVEVDNEAEGEGVESQL